MSVLTPEQLLFAVTDGHSFNVAAREAAIAHIAELRQQVEVERGAAAIAVSLMDGSELRAQQAEAALEKQHAEATDHAAKLVERGLLSERRLAEAEAALAESQREVERLTKAGESLCCQNGNLLVQEHDLKREVETLRRELHKPCNCNAESQREVERLTRERDEAQRMVKWQTDGAVAARARAAEAESRIDALLTERERMKAALEHISRHPCAEYPKCMCCFEDKEYADAALSATAPAAEGETT